MIKSTEDTVMLHRITKADEEKIYELIWKKLNMSASDSAATRKSKEKKKKDFEDFLLKITPLVRDKPRAKGPRRLCYEDIPAILDLTGISYLDLLKILSEDPDGNRIAPAWALDSEAKMCVYCDLMQSNQRSAVLLLIKRILAPVFYSSTLIEESSIMRLYRVNTLRTFCVKEMGRQAINLGVNDIFHRRYLPYSFNAIELKLISFMSISFDVSPHWLLGLDDSRTVLAASGDTEMIMDLFCFLPDERKDIILRAAETALSEGGVL